MPTETLHRPELTTEGPIAAPILAPSRRTNTDLIKALPASLRSEWIKLTSLRSNGAILGLTAGVGGFISWAVAHYVTDEVLTISETFTFATVFTAVFSAIAGILLFSSEVEHGTLAPTLTAQTSRSVVALSKALTAAMAGLVIGAVGLAVGVAGSWAGGIEMGDTSTMLDTSLWALLFVSLSSILGLGVGMIARRSTAAISGLLVWWLVVENLLGVFVSEKYARLMPFTAGNELLGVQTGPEETSQVLNALTSTQNAMLFGGYALGALAIGTVLLHRRDTN